MQRVIDLDQAVKDKDSDGLIFTLTIAGEKYGVSSEEIIELIRTKAGVSGRSKKGPKGKASSASESNGDSHSDSSDHHEDSHERSAAGFGSEFVG